MLSDEEKEAIETIKFFKEMKWYSHASDNGTEILSEDEKQDIDIVLNLIEKQQKEIEEVKEKNKILEAISLSFNEIQDRDKKWEYKIKAKIEELDKQEEDLQNSISDEEREEYSDANISWKLMDIQIRREVLQSLLEKE